MKTDELGRYVRQDLVGHKFDRLTVVGSASKERRWSWLCKCDCGNTAVRRADSLKSGHNQSCGCLQREISRATRKRVQTTHGMSDTLTGNSWMAMMDRCFNKRSKSWKIYGGAGRTVCEFIRSSPVNLVLLIGYRPKGLSIDRIENKGSYTCGQCAECLTNKWPMNIRWATSLEQTRNKESVIQLTIGGQTKYIGEWSKLTGIQHQTIYLRFKHGWDKSKLLIPSLRGRP